jgi:hypothetical protein
VVMVQTSGYSALAQQAGRGATSAVSRPPTGCRSSWAPLAARGICGTMVVATVMLVRAGEAFINPGGHSWESAALYAILMLCLMMLGAGSYSLDAVLFKRDPVARGAESSAARGGGEP